VGIAIRDVIHAVLLNTKSLRQCRLSFKAHGIRDICLSVPRRWLAAAAWRSTSKSGCGP
jgi:hypothetical protein